MWCSSTGDILDIMRKALRIAIDLRAPNSPNIYHTSVRCDLRTMHACMYGHTYSKSKDQPGKVANPARGQLSRENEYFPVPVRA